VGDERLRAVSKRRVVRRRKEKGRGGGKEGTKGRKGREGWVRQRTSERTNKIKERHTGGTKR